MMRKYSDLVGEDCILQRKGEERGQKVRVGEVNKTHVACHFENGGVLYVPHEEIESLEQASKDRKAAHEDEETEEYKRDRGHERPA